ncbi:hypothetical protein K469DRAFT_709787 [Zopfia rhizophila CBS 207.26]|uniref:RNA-binding domain-containing protein n=1 Tax=Zopfia rhizophila CBS 207.26 TaxID=1314779 RepID=A0A6A6EW04_9PEZI|nr:hypothetical protein K469DRAFT_709787 [Zopfia rhizophila CBS 207.26]
MHVDDADKTILKQWIIPKLEKISDADADVLADYVIALVTTDESDEAVKQSCLDALPDFLHDHTGPFIDEVINAIRNKSYLSSPELPAPALPSAPSLSAEAAPFNPPTGPSAGTIRQTHLPSLLNGLQNGKGDQSRKRSYNDRETSEPRDVRDSHYNRGDRPFKQAARRGGRNSRGGFGGPDINMGSMAGFGGMPNSMAPMSNIPALSTSGGFQAFDPANPMSSFLAMTAMGMGLPGMPSMAFAGSPPFGQSGSNNQALPPGRKERCKDYDTKGYCVIGSLCPYEHGEGGAAPFVIPPSSDEYDPNQASLAIEPQKSAHGQRGLQGNRGGFRGRGGGSTGGRARAPFSQAGPTTDRSNTTVVVEQIPEEKFSEDAVRGFFSEFGTIVDVQMQPYKRLAIVKFNDHLSASRAYNSPKVIFDNRFVKVYWYKPESLPTLPGNANANANGAIKASSPPVVKGKDEEMFDAAEVEKKQAEAQKAYEEKVKRRQEADAQREELQKQLRAKDEEKRKLLEKLGKKAGEKVKTAEDTPMESNDSALIDQLSSLQAEALNLGTHGDVSPFSSRGRGRGGYRGRGAFAPRARGYYGSYRGAYRGRGFTGSPFGTARGGVKRWDSRPKRIAANGAEPGSQKDEALREYLLNNFDFESIDQHPDRKDAQIITFKERYVAEKFIDESSEIPDVGQLELSWVTNTPAASAAQTEAASKAEPVSAEQLESEGDVDMEEQAEHMEQTEQTNGGTDTAVNGGDADYDVADDEDRWMAA